ncbi:MAG TPA: GTPase HflX, partial [Porphyromonadaceae bacterium]|nr:GTPase HflX [Porphyromonadaceae bacterium]HBU46510.1 GTPase HflX [Porphyromonadaceae bacterium]
LKIRILDRTSLILDIFAMRAQTSHAKAQVELAQYQYLLPRLTRMWTHLERQRGGGGVIMRGPGETQLET